MNQNTLIAIVGPTASGKSELAEKLAQELAGEIVSADSMQVYLGMDIGTAKVPLSRRGTTYHCLDLVAPNEEFNAFLYQKAARKAFDDIWAQGKQPILCGGTGLYVRAAVEDFIGQNDPAPLSAPLSAALSAAPQGRRQRLTAEAEELGPEAFHAKLAAIDPESAALIHPNNVRRVVRAFEWLEQGSSYKEQASEFDTNAEIYPVIYLGLTLPREILYERINARVTQMIEQGLLEEVQGLLDKGYGQALSSQQAIGYKELIGVLSGEKPLETAVEQMQQATRHYAKRQLSWFKRYKSIHWLDAQQPTDDLLQKALAFAHQGVAKQAYSGGYGESQ